MTFKTSCKHGVVKCNVTVHVAHISGLSVSYFLFLTLGTLVSSPTTRRFIEAPGRNGESEPRHNRTQIERRVAPRVHVVTSL